MTEELKHNLVQYVDVIFSEIEQGEYKEALKTTSQLRQRIKDGVEDLVCPNCNCLVELLN